jgi:hypothetical protein
MSLYIPRTPSPNHSKPFSIHNADVDDIKSCGDVEQKSFHKLLPSGSKQISARSKRAVEQTDKYFPVKSGRNAYSILNLLYGAKFAKMSATLLGFKTGKPSIDENLYNEHPEINFTETLNRDQRKKLLELCNKFRKVCLVKYSEDEKRIINAARNMSFSPPFKTDSNGIIKTQVDNIRHLIKTQTIYVSKYIKWKNKINDFFIKNNILNNNYKSNYHTLRKKHDNLVEYGIQLSEVKYHNKEMLEMIKDINDIKNLCPYDKDISGGIINWNAPKERLFEISSKYLVWKNQLRYCVENLDNIPELTNVIKYMDIEKNPIAVHNELARFAVNFNNRVDKFADEFRKKISEDHDGLAHFLGMNYLK